MNRPTSGPCWVAYQRVGARKVGVFFVKSPASIYPGAAYLNGGAGERFDGRFGLVGVEPFTQEVDAIAAALRIGGFVARIDEGESTEDAQARLRAR